MKNIQELPPLEELNRLFDYRINTGELIRKVAGRGGNAPIGSVVGCPNKFGHSRSVNKFNSVKRTSSLYPGVNLKNGRFVVRICVDYKRIQIGTYATLQEAINARKQAERELAIERDDDVLLERAS